MWEGGHVQNRHIHGKVRSALVMHNRINPGRPGQYKTSLLSGLWLSHGLPRRKTDCIGHHSRGNQALGNPVVVPAPDVLLSREPRLGPEVLRRVPVLGVTGSQMPDAEG
jgi:hypothetical protein